MAEPPPHLLDRFQVSYDDETSCCDVLIMGPGVNRSLKVMKAHRVVLSAGSSAFRRHFEEHGGVKVIDIEDILGSDFQGPEKRRNFEIVLKYLYGMPVFGDDEKCNRVLLDELLDVASQLGVPSLSEHTIISFERSLEAYIVDPLTGLVNDEPDILGFLQHVKLVSNPDLKSLDEVVVKLCCKHYSLIHMHEEFGGLVSEYPELPKLMLQYAARQRDGSLL